MDSGDRAPWLRYGVAVISVGIIVLFKLLVLQVAGRLGPFVLSLVPVILSAWYGGLGAGLLATALTAAADGIYFLPAAGSHLWRFHGTFLVSIFLVEGAVISVLSAARDRAQGQRRRSEEALRNWEYVINHAGWGIVLVDPMDHRIRTANPAFAAMHGFTVEELKGRPLPEMLSPESTGAFVQHARVALTTDHHVYEAVHLRKDGSTFPALMDVTALRDAQGVVLFRAVYCQDITERKQLEQKLREAQKLESLGVLAGGLAHDFNNLLTGIIGNAGLALDKLPPDDPVRENLADVMCAGESAAHLTRQMLAYAGKGRFVIQPLNLSDAVRESARAIQTSIPKKVRLELDLDDQIPVVDADAVQIQQLILNLVMNGAEAIGDQGGTVSVSTTGTEIAEGQAGDLRPGVYACLAVADNGCGMDEPTRARMFDPFFSTKFTGRGLGLAAVSGIVRGHDGGLSVSSVPGKGSMFRVFLPASQSGVAGVGRRAAGDRASSAEGAGPEEVDPPKRRLA
jgi:PAS domain S-box-containing protein